MNLVYLFPEALPLPRARGIQVAHTVVELAKLGIAVTLIHAPGEAPDPIATCGLVAPKNLNLASVSRRLPWPIQRIQSNKIYFYRLRHILKNLPSGTVVMMRHIKLAAMVLRTYPILPVLYEAHEVFADTAASGQRERISSDELLVMERASAIVTNSSATAKRITELYPVAGDKLTVIPNGVDLGTMNQARDWQELKRNVIYAGSFFGWKGVADLVMAASELPDFHIRLIGGDTAQKSTLQDLVPNCKAELEFQGRMPHAEVMRALGDACIAVLPNRPDTDSMFTSPIKLFEYMGAGCAVVASDLPSIREVLREDEAEWFVPGNPESLRDALLRLARDPERAKEMGLHLRKKAENYTWTARAERLRGVLEKI